MQVNLSGWIVSEDICYIQTQWNQIFSQFCYQENLLLHSELTLLVLSAPLTLFSPPNCAKLYGLAKLQIKENSCLFLSQIFLDPAGKDIQPVFLRLHVI